MLEMSVNFLREEEEILREIKTIPEQMIRILQCLKISETPGADGVCPRDEKPKNLCEYRQHHIIIENTGRLRNGE